MNYIDKTEYNEKEIAKRRRIQKQDLINHLKEVHKEVGNPKEVGTLEEGAFVESTGVF